MGLMGRRSGLSLATAGVAMVVATATAWACVPEGTPGTLQVFPAQARPGEQVRISGTAGSKSPVSVYLPTGAPVATFPVSPGAEGHGYQFGADVTLPADVPAGTTALVANQDGLRWQTELTLVRPGPAVVAGPATTGATGTGAGPDGSGSAVRAALAIGSAIVVLAAVSAWMLRRRGSSPSLEEERPPVSVG